MITSDQLAALLMQVSVKELSRRSGVAEKTVYRLRHQTTKPSFSTLHRLLPAIERMQAEAAKSKVKQPEAA